MNRRRGFVIVNPYQPQLLGHHPRPRTGLGAVTDALDRLAALGQRLGRLEDGGKQAAKPKVRHL